MARIDLSALCTLVLVGYTYTLRVGCISCGCISFEFPVTQLVMEGISFSRRDAFRLSAIHHLRNLSHIDPDIFCPVLSPYTKQSINQSKYPNSLLNSKYKGPNLPTLQILKVNNDLYKIAFSVPIHSHPDILRINH